MPDLADWATASSLVDGVLFSPEQGEKTLPICAVAQARGFRGFGKGTTRSEALASALGEAMEQYAAAQVPRDRLIRASFRELGRMAFDRRWLRLYSDEQYGRSGFPYRPFREDDPQHWIAGHWMDDATEVYLPAAAVYLSEEFEQEAFCQTTSNGLGAGESLHDAAGRAALELRERDAFVTSWISCRGAVRIQTVPESASIRQICARLEGEGARLETYMVANGDPAFVAVSVGLGDGIRWPSVALGLGAGLTREQAVDRAILEHGQTGPYLADTWRSGGAKVPGVPEEIQTLEDHALYYCSASHRGEFDAWRDSATDAPVAPKPGACRIAIVDLTPPELQESPFRVARALAHGLQPIYAGYGMERTYTDALKQALGWAMWPHGSPARLLSATSGTYRDRD